MLPRPETPLAPPAPVVKAAEPAAVKKQVAKPIVNPASVPKIDAPVKAAPPPPPPPQPASAASFETDKVYRVQLAAVRSADTAESEWMRLKKKNEDLLGGLTLDVIKIDLGADKGIFYRLRAGPLASEAAAKNLCEQLSVRKIGCLIVRPGG